MKLCEALQCPETAAPRCPLRSAPPTQPLPLKPKPADRVTFGMAMNLDAPCCVAKVKTGRKDGCCNTVPHAVFVERYRAAVLRETEKNGIRPKLDADIQAVLDGKPPKPAKPATPEPQSKATKAAPTSNSPVTPPARQSRATQILMAPIRFIKWFLVGLWEDLKLLFSGEKPG